MVRYVYAAKQNPGTIVNKIGKYLNSNIDGTFKMKFHPMECEIYMRMYYQVPERPETLDEMQFIISITSYQNKIRINITENNALEKTIGQVILKPEEYADAGLVKKKVLWALKKAIGKEYSEYDFIY